MPFATRAGRPSCRPGCARTLVDPLSRTWVASATAGGSSEPPGRPIALSGRPRGWGPLHAYATGALPRSPQGGASRPGAPNPPARTATRPRKPGTRCSGTRGTLDPHRGCRAIRSVTGTGVGVGGGAARRRGRRLGDDRQDAWLQARRASTRGHVASSGSSAQSDAPSARWHLGIVLARSGCRRLRPAAESRRRQHCPIPARSASAGPAFHLSFGVRLVVAYSGPS